MLDEFILFMWLLFIAQVLHTVVTVIQFIIMRNDGNSNFKRQHDDYERNYELNVKAVYNGSAASYKERADFCRVEMEYLDKLIELEKLKSDNINKIGEEVYKNMKEEENNKG